MTYTLTVSAENPQELADLLSVLTAGIKPAKASKQASAPVIENANQEDAGSTDNEVVKVTKEMVRELTAEKVQAGKTADVKRLLTKYKAKNAATVPEESFTAYYNDLKAI